MIRFVRGDIMIAQVTMLYSVDAEIPGDAIDLVSEGFESADVCIDGAECQNVSFKTVEIED